MLKHATINRTSRAHTSQLRKEKNDLEFDDKVREDAALDKNKSFLRDHSFLASSERNESDLNNNNNSNDNHPLLQISAHSFQRNFSSPAPVFSGSSCESSPCQSVLSTPSKIRPNQQASPLKLNSLNDSFDDSLPQISSSNKCKSESIIKIHAQSLGQQVEYITLSVNTQTKSNQVVKSLLKKFRLKHRDPNLYYLTLERWIRKDGLKFKSVMLLGDEACPLQLQQCCSNPPHHDIKFTLQMRAGALVKIFCSDVVPDAQYKYVSLSTQTTVDETIELILHCLNLVSIAVCNLKQSENQSRNSDSPATCSTTSSSSSSSNSSASTSSGIESEPNNWLQVIGSKTGSSRLISNTNRCVNDPPSKIPLNNHLDSNSRASSITSISSTSNISSISSAIVEQYCLVIECKNTNYQRILGSNEYLVGVYQNLLAEAQSHSDGTEITQRSEYDDDGKSTRKSDQSKPDQWFSIKLKRRDCSGQTTIKFTSPRLNMPLPPIPSSIARQNADSLKQFVTTTQIEVNCGPTTSLAMVTGPGNEVQSNNLILKSCNELRSNTVTGNADEVDSISRFKQLSQTDSIPHPPLPARRAHQPPPQFIVLEPPIKPRSRNLSNASSTFVRPAALNKRRYDPAQLAVDIDRLDLRD